MKKESNNSKDKLSTEEKLQNAISELALQNELLDKRSVELTNAINELAIQNDLMDIRSEQLAIANRELAYQNEEKQKRAEELLIVNKEVTYQNEEKQKRAEELLIANKELIHQNKEKQKRAEELLLANKELDYQYKENQKRAEELLIANKELAYQYKEKQKRAEELLIANKELAFQNEEKEKRTAELIIANKKIVFQNEQKEKRAAELLIANKELAYQNEEKHKRAEELLIANQELAYLNADQQTLFASIVNSSDDAMLSTTLDGIITSWNHGAEKVFGYAAEEIIGKHIFILVPQHLQNEEFEIAQKIRSGETVDHHKTERVKKDDTVFHASLTTSPTRNWKSEITGVSKIIRDITLNVIAEDKLIKSKRMYALISAINQMIVKVTDETGLYSQACSIAVDIGKFKMAWIGMIDDETKNVIPVAHASEEDDYLTEMSPISIDDIPGGRGPTGKSLREGRHIVCNDIENAPQMAPWKEAAAKRGYLSSIAFPLTKSGKVVGSFSLYAPIKEFFDEAEIFLLEEAVNDISFELESIEKAKLHKKAEENLKENYALSRMAGEIAKLGGWNVKLGGNRVYWSDEVATLHEMPPGYAPLVEEAIQFYTPEWRDRIREVFTNCLQKGIPYDELMEIFTASGKRIWVRTIGEAIRDTEGIIVKVNGAFQDVTERKKIEKALEEYKYALDESSIVAIADQKGIIKHVNENFWLMKTSVRYQNTAQKN